MFQQKESGREGHAKQFSWVKLNESPGNDLLLIQIHFSG